MSKIKKTVEDYFKEKNKFVLFAFFVIWSLTFIAFINTIIIGDWVKIGLSFAALMFYLIPSFVSYRFKLRLPATLEITFYLFVFASLVLGEVFAFYGPFPFWDIILHLLSGFVIAGIGLSIVEIINKGEKSRLFTLLFAFCFSMTLGTMWECLEFTFDMTARTDAQKDAHVRQISTITLQRDGGNRPVRLNNIEKTDIYLQNGEVITIDEGFLDIGIMDTMKDILVNMVGATLFCIMGASYLKNSKKDTIVKKFIPIKN
ncbi:hypothetical protein IJJ05_01240 [Candidatus Saccharibacteria bacterium]|nr:hypothetical protein [Candidatus Saccharibacteria bacterium]